MAASTGTSVVKSLRAYYLPLVDQVSGGGGLSSIDVTDDDKVDVNLLFSL